MVSQVPVGEFYSNLYVERGAPRKDSSKFRRRIGAFYVNEFGQMTATDVAASIAMETGYPFSRPTYASRIELFFHEADLVDVFTGVTIVWRVIYDSYARQRAPDWREFIARALKEENLSYRVDNRCGIHPLVDQEFEQNRVSVLSCLMDARYTAVQHAVDAAFEQLNAVPMDGKGAARNIFEAAESMAKTVAGSNSALTEQFVDKELRPICDRLFTSDPQLKTTAGRLLSSFAKWVDAIHPYRHGHDREEPLILPDDLAVLAVSQGAGFIRWLVDVDRRQSL